MNRQRLAPLERPAIMEEIDKKAADVRANMARLRELRLAKEAQEVRTEISPGDQPTKVKPKKRFDRYALSAHGDPEMSVRCGL
jgi:hypothetical protein